jgi:hypothetical protein
MKGNQQPVEHFEPNFEGRYARKKLAGLLNRLPRLQPSFSITGVDFRVFNWPATAAVYAACCNKVKRKFEDIIATNTVFMALCRGL